MAKQKVLILNKERIDRKLQRMAYQLWEQNSNEDGITMIGIDGSGLAVARNLADILTSISPLKVEVMSLKMNKRKPLAKEIVLDADLSDKSVVLVDDVANSGKTLLYALKPILNFDVRKIIIAVLVERKHKSYPVSPDIIGHSVATTLKEHIEVETRDDIITGAYLM